MKKIKFLNKTLLTSMIAVSLMSSCNEEDAVVPEKMPAAIENTKPYDYVERFTIDKNGNKAPIQSSSLNARPASSFYRSDMTIAELDRNNIKPGARHAYNRLHALAPDGANRPTFFVDYDGDKNSRFWGIAVKQRHYGYISTVRTRDPKKYSTAAFFRKNHPNLKPVGVEYRTVVTASFKQPIGGREELLSIVELGKKGRETSLSGNLNNFTFTETKTNTMTHGVSFGYSLSVTAEAGFLFGSVSATAETSFGANFENSTTRSTSQSSRIGYSSGHSIPKGKKCRFTWTRQKFRSTKRYKVYTKVYGGLLATHGKKGGTSTDFKIFYSTNGAYSIFDKTLKDGKAGREFTVTSELYDYEIKRENCFNL